MMIWNKSIQFGTWEQELNNVQTFGMSIGKYATITKLKNSLHLTTFNIDDF